MRFLSYLLFFVGMAVTLCGMLGAGLMYTLIGIVLTLAGGILWGLTPPKDQSGRM